MDQQLSSERPDGLYTSSLLWVLLVIGVAAIAGAWGWQWYRQQPAVQAALPVYGMVSDFTLIERSGQAFGQSELRGRIWIVNFFFSKCTEACSRTMPEMARLQERLVDIGDVPLVSITIDPAHDVAFVLTEFAWRFNARPGRWYFLTGDQQVIYDLSLNTFHMAVEEVPEAQRQPGDDGFLHAEHFVLVDRQAQIRGYYDPLDDEAMSRLLQEVRWLVKQN